MVELVDTLDLGSNAYSVRVQISLGGFIKMKGEEYIEYFNFVEAIKKVEDKKMEKSAMSIVRLWKKRSFEKIEKEKDKKILDILETDDKTYKLLECWKELTGAGLKVEITVPDMIDKAGNSNKEVMNNILKETEKNKVQINKTVEEVEALLELCAGSVEKQMEILCSYRIVEYPFGRMVVGGSVCDK